MAPFQYDAYRDPQAGSIASLTLRRGDIAAQQAERQGAIRANAVANIGGSISNALGDVIRYKQEAPLREMQAMKLQAARQGMADEQTDRQARLQAQHDEMASRIGHEILLGGGTPDAVAQTMQRAVKSGALSPDEAQQFTLMSVEHAEKIPDAAKALLARSSTGQALLDKWNAPAKQAEPFTLKEGETRFGPDGKPVAALAPKPEKVTPPKKYPVTVPGPDGKPITKLVSEEEMAQGVPAYREPRVAPERAGIWIQRNGQTLRVQENEIRPGDTPMNTREQGRPVTSGDASDLADFDSSLDDLKVLREAIASAGSTGIIAQAGASLPYVTQITGWGADAKKKQALIDRVKQVIGKTLEGGVLRKEDEEKYKKILPNIGDENSVVVSKLDGLESAIAKKKGRRLDALGDANYDVSKYRARAEGQDGAITPGNIDLANRPRVKNADGSISTVRSMSINEDGKEILIPTVVNGRVMSDEEAIAAYHKTGQHLGVFATPAAATAYAKKLHESEAAKLGAGQKSGRPAEGTEGSVKGVAAVWKTVNGVPGWYRK